MNRNGRKMLAERTPRRDYMVWYMRKWRAGRVVRRKPRGLRPHFNRPGYCDNCGHRWDAGSRCPLCCLESASLRSLGVRFHVRRWIAWAHLMEAIAA